MKTLEIIVEINPSELDTLINICKPYSNRTLEIVRINNINIIRIRSPHQALIKSVKLLYPEWIQNRMKFDIFFIQTIDLDGPIPVWW